MINETAYLEAIANASLRLQKWNSKSVATRVRTNAAVFDQQTGIVQRPADGLHRSRLERCVPASAQQIVAYPARRYCRAKEISTDACEFKYFLNANSAIGDAINALVNPGGGSGGGYGGGGGGGGVAPPAEHGEHQDTPTRQTHSASRAGTYQEMYDMDPFEDDLIEESGDEDDWGSSRRKRRKKNADAPASSSRSSRRHAAAAAAAFKELAPSSALTPAPSGGPLGTPNANGGGGGGTSSAGGERTFVCHQCNASYKSRPGLMNHRLHRHKEEALILEMPKILASSLLSPSLDVSTQCDVCKGSNQLNTTTNAPEDLVSCHDCGRSAHPSCVGFTANMLESTRQRGWQCIECKSCSYCGSSADDDQLLFCDDCDRGFHFYCLKPRLKKAPEGSWSCYWCQREFAQRASLPPQPPAQ